MNIFGFNLSLRRKEAIPAEALLPPSPPPVPMMGASSDWGFPAAGGTLTNAYQQVVWVYRAINALAEQVANLPFRFSGVRRRGEEVITSGPLIEFYERPHPLMNRFQYWEMRVMWLMLRGECFRLPIWKNNRLSRVFIVDPDCMTHVVENGSLVGWRYQSCGGESPLQSQVFLAEEVWHEKLANPFSFWRGMSPLSVCAVAAGCDYAAGLHMRSLMENNGEMGLMVRTDEPLDNEQREQVLAALRERKRRAGTADRPILLWGGAEITQPTLSSGDAQFLANRRFNVSEICAAFGVPEEIITSTNAAKYDVMRGARLAFVENRVVPLCRRLEAAEQVTVQSLDPNARGWFDVEDHPVLTQARLERLSAARAAWEMGQPLNEVSRVYDLGLKPMPWGDIGYVPGNVVQVGEAETQ